MTHTVLITKGTADLDRLHHACPGVELIEVADFESPPRAVRATVAALRSGTSLGRRQLDRLPMLQHVVRAGSGTDNIDVHQLAQRGITLHRNPHASTAAVAEWCLVAALSLARRIPLGHNGLVQGQHLKTTCLGVPLSDLNVAIWGAGPVGRATAELLAPFTRSVSFASWPSNPPELRQLSVRLLVQRADLHVLAVPLRPETRGRFGQEFLTGVADRRPLVLCAGRIETLNVGAFLRALDAERITGLALDSIDPEHTGQVNALTGPRNLLVTPHVGAQRTDVRHELDAWLLRVLTSITAGSAPHPGDEVRGAGQ
ncbi:NAD(P)-dependent oxidoreductase [Actinomadura harenae]|uniref:Hydroxyacid dehydrogenase n=1 Tax=Actinomadura harenae TaxID=2483351 RepID=A0A3M2LJ56_9ACTN|nr:NAD(P)-dependent oxidoreductase [Actinomadura harenae]RMI37509.1 hydroxyacid dehydrogenase [Actinomadura harenae]